MRSEGEVPRHSYQPAPSFPSRGTTCCLLTSCPAIRILLHYYFQHNWLRLYNEQTITIRARNDIICQLPISPLLGSRASLAFVYLCTCRGNHSPNNCASLPPSSLQYQLSHQSRPVNSFSEDLDLRSCCVIIRPIATCTPPTKSGNI